MPNPNGDRTELRAYYDEGAGRHKLEVDPETLRICKRNTRVLSITAKNETVGSDHYRPIVLGYRIQDSPSSGTLTDPKLVFSDAPNFPGSSFLVPDDGKPCYFTIKRHLELKERATPCSFPDKDPADGYSVVIRFSHDGWDDAAGSGEHVDWHVES